MIRTGSILFLSLLLASTVSNRFLYAQDAAAHPAPQSSSEPAATLPDAPSAALQDSGQARQPADQDRDYEGKQTRRILWIVPTFRSVSVDEKLPPLSVHDKYKLMMDDNFDYSNFIYVGLLAGMSQVEGSYPEFHTCAPAYARYYWHNFADTLDGNLMTELLLPLATKEDPRYYTLGHGGFSRGRDTRYPGSLLPVPTRAAAASTFLRLWAMVRLRVSPIFTIQARSEAGQRLDSAG